MMVDIHSHILPGLDDGASNFEDSLEMLRVARKAGTTDIAATPHANFRYPFDAAAVEQRIAELQEAAGPEIRIHYGCDLHLSYENVQDALANPQRYTLNHRCYLLVEFPDLVIFENTGEIFRRFLEKGVVPVITHPERHRSLQRHRELLRQWVELGCALQVTAHALTGLFGRRAERCARDLLDEGLVAVVASDAHDATERSPDLRPAWQW
ncbi:MAG: exopolysaccharide biosynthesis protein, partial [Thermoleophilia bacterium]|nr:exopolysaccharide biosynthesis protein [Thermoleophilia bacterium]